ncbi:hypothetical protein [Nocardia vinacea]|uniref:hypothetical protein n=1 Tax=Nocardia vinacea TaxID=96468 RepID=UPI0012F6C19E|nr:hypothetical protein [Nocardia vinacea]
MRATLSHEQVGIIGTRRSPTASPIPWQALGLRWLTADDASRPSEGAATAASCQQSGAIVVIVASAAPQQL